MILYDNLGNPISRVQKLGGSTIIDTRTQTQNISALNGEVVMDIEQENGISIDIRGTFVGTMQLQYSINGTDYVAYPVMLPTEIFTINMTVVGTYISTVPSAVKKVRVISTAWTSGTAIISLRGSDRDNMTYSKQIPTTNLLTVTGAAAAAVTLTIPSPSTGLFNYITTIQIHKFATALLTAAATPVLITTTNISGSPAFTTDADAQAQGVSKLVLDLLFTNPLKSTTAATATTIVCPATTGAIWRVNVGYYVG